MADEDGPLALQSPGFTTQEVARLLGIAPGEIRAWMRDGLVRPARDAGGELRFGFQDLVLLRTLQRLVRDVPRGAVRRAVRGLQAREADLTGVRLDTESGAVVVREQDGSWDPASGQIVFDWEARDPTSEVAVLRGDAPVAERPAPTEPERSAEDWYADGCEQEDHDPEAARAAYLRAIALDPGHVDARVNLGRMYHVSEELPAAEAQYRAALAHEPANVTAAFNLAVALEDMRRRPEALAVYEGLIATDPTFPDAYYNAACLCEALDRPQDALRYLREYRTLTRG